jgi:hypothetical protein
MTTHTMTDIKDIAKGIKHLVEHQKYQEAYEKYFSPDLVSAEPQPGPDGSREAEGMAAVAKKGAHWHATMDTHAVEVSEPLIADQHFVMKYRFDVTEKETNKRYWMQELAMYTVENGKIVREEFFYPACSK